MKVSYNWLSESLDLSAVTPGELAEQITLTGIEVDGVTEPATELSNIVVGHVLEAERMEESDHLNITTVNVGLDEAVQIVCGAPNVKAGQKVVVALPGARLANGLKIKKSKLRGVVSNGMICSLEELGFSDSVIPKNAEDGIYVLPENAETGTDALPYVGLADAFIELDITPNRADALSMRGVAFEAGAILSQKPEFPGVNLIEDSSNTIEDFIKVSVENTEDNSIYKMRVIKDLVVTESPLWLQKKLMHAGIRPIDAIVDVTNYIMLEYGQPLHAFDYDTLNSKEIQVRRAKDSETLVTLDGQTRHLNQDNLVITNGTIPVALAGVMGGENTHVTAETKTVALESAVFESSLIRKTAQSLNLRSESSSRFEKGLNKATVQQALDHAAALIASLGQGQVVTGTAQVESEQPVYQTVTTSVDKINRTLGTDLTVSDLDSIFERLGFDSEVTAEQVNVTVPPRRWDITIEADIIEEVARIHGYSKLPSTLPHNESLPGELTYAQQITRFTRHYMESCGLGQAISYALTTTEKAKAFAHSATAPVELDWPMSEEHKALRQSLISGLLDNVQYNVARQSKNVALFEIGRVFEQTESTLPKETSHVAGVMTGAVVENSWQEKEVTVDYFAVKGIVEEWFDTLGVSDSIRFVPSKEHPDMHPGRTADVFWNDELIGMIGQLHPLMAQARDLNDTVLFELNLDPFITNEHDTIRFKSIPKYPGTSRDIAFVVEESVLHQDILKTMHAAGGKWLRSIRLFDLYQGENIENGKKSLAYTLSYLNPDATLKEDEVNTDFNQVKEALAEKYSADIR
ncbi:phenylalanine--tRNA ligase subunit beta [Alkalibacterium olivapovliticus]|uniref:Phenylalanine--tRNA ligase beta subunit n=1 Tax=Alkalibacterium olivapovliticus TaxID=99907 RepID=A0A2T0VUS9_9LACT|nr:phenylalanine--tRNA ligase subunit beta [Alkalibacterium olivapovliticus]PRY75179.1 phenylalanyl-tRNA synthetase beta chain [Alkalibacterium olivapovliticus]